LFHGIPLVTKATTKEGYGQFYFKDGELIEWMDAGESADKGLVKMKDLYAKREISIKGWADEARKRIEEHSKESGAPLPQ